MTMCSLTRVKSPGAVMLLQARVAHRTMGMAHRTMGMAHRTFGMAHRTWGDGTQDQAWAMLCPGCCFVKT